MLFNFLFTTRILVYFDALNIIILIYNIKTIKTEAFVSLILY